MCGLDRKGIVLLTTVGLILMLSLLILKSIDVSQKYFERANDRSLFVQLNRSFLDILAILQKNSQNVKDAQSLSTIVGLPIILNTDSGDINVMIEIASAGSVININNLILSNNDINEPLYNFLQNILYEYRVTNSNFFLSVLLDAIDKDKNERTYASEAALQSYKFSDGGINSKESFSYLLDYFVANGGDAKIYNVPWEEIVGFFGKDIDFNYIKEPLFTLIKKEYNLHSLTQDEIISSYDELAISASDKNKLRALNIGFFSPRIFCSMSFFYSGQTKLLNFLYDMETKKVDYIETIF
ncbi:MAG: hypothetical protein LBH45_06095 [Campylobacteraceae bacterium]|jgi:DNA-directed RNA polymerase|nr:hypothetical protein [Campylobacteraceae bacterium]